MDNSTSQTRFTELLDNEILSRLERMRLNPRRRLTNRSRGEHLAGKGGISTEFSDYRNYVPGDDVRFVDWNIFSRLHRPYLKLYEHEEEMHVVLLIDASSSMLFEQKFWRARQLAAAFGLMGLMNLEKVSLYVCHHRGQRPVFLPPCTGRVNRKRLFEFLENIEGGGDAPVDQAVESVLRHHRGRGIAVLLSDFLTFGDLQRPMNRLFSAGLEIFGVQILSPAELDPEVSGDLRLLDCETGQTLDVSSAGELLGFYHEYLAELQEQLAQLCRKRNGRFLRIDAQAPLEWVLFDRLRRQGWVQ